MGFLNDSLYPAQERNNASVALQPEYYHEWENRSSLTLVPFARLDSADSRRSHVDIRELNYLWLGDSWELRVGIGKVFWGVTEFVHLVDIINQTDLVEAFDGEEKLGQPMVDLTLPMEWGTIDLFVLPYFRERTFPGPAGRLRSALVVDTDNPTYESAAEEHHVDFAIRYSRSIGHWEIGLSHFHGTGREPTLLMGSNAAGDPVLTPYYEQIRQSGLDLQLITGGWLWKLEGIYRSGQGPDDFFSGAFGFEYTFSGVFGTPADVGVIAEYIKDERDEKATTPLQDDVAIGVRLAFNDAASSEALIGVVQDTETSARLITVEASRRVGSSWKATLEVCVFSNVSPQDALYDLRNDDYLRLELAYYF
ncbi:MAG: hypothetical protein JSV40_04125 [Deltaproteobacteria bacterium]|nr:MAG: hypothetical protein JSV40_04125 [Deltaproteobacteria bacterium]